MLDGEGQWIRFIDYIRNNRIELNTVLAVAKPEAFWNWLKYKILETWPRRDYRRVITPTTMDIRTPTMLEFDDWLVQQINPIITPHAERIENQLSDVDEFIEDVGQKEEEIRTDIRQHFAE
jgi:hypothetical protein